MISHIHKCIFIHIPKCAGTSIEHVLGHFDGFEGRGGQDHRTIRMIEPISLSRLRLSNDNVLEFSKRIKNDYFRRHFNPKNKYSVTKYEYDSYLKFSVVRNPWARAFSWYKNVIRDDNHLRTHSVTSKISFKEFLIKFAGKGNLRPQTDWLQSYDGTIQLDFILRFENISNELEEVFKRLNLSNVQLPHKKKSNSLDYRTYYDDQLNQIILDTYGKEIELFDYRFEN